MAIRVVMAGATGWVGRALIPAIAAQGDMTLAGAVARNAAGQDSGTALGFAPNGVAVSATLDEALALPSDVVVDYTKPDVVKGNTLTAISNGRHVVIGTSGLGAAIEAAWATEPRQIVVQTCTLDHPAALPLYQKLGFSPVGQKREQVQPMPFEERAASVMRP